MKHFELTVLALLFSVSSFAVIGPITGPSSLCQGYTGAPFSDTTPGGTWSSSNPAVISIGSSSGVVSTLSAGAVTITYTRGAGHVTTSVYVNPLPAAFTLYAGGSGGICAGGPGDHIYLSGSQSGFSYQLYSAGVPVGTPQTGFGSTVDFGAVSTPGTYTATGTDPSSGCWSTMSGSAGITLLPTPAAIGGPSGVCVGSAINLSDATTGGAWSSSNPAVAAVGSTGIVTGIGTGSTIISYTVSSGCAATTSITAVNLVAPISGPVSVCSGIPATLSDASPGGAWVSSNPSVATIGSSSGIITGLTAGTTTIHYTVGGSCGAVTSTVTVHASPAAITGVTSVCAGAVSTLADATTGGTWTSANTAIATIGSASGIATSVAAGTTAISYTVAGCSAGINFTVDPRPLLSGPTNVCVTSFITLHTSINGSWTSSNPAVASVSAGYLTGTVTGLYPGTAIMTCNSYSTGCVSTYSVSVTSSCSGTPAAGAAHAVIPSVCSGSADIIYLSGATSACGISYQWQSSPDSLAWTNLAGATNDSAFIHPQASLYYRCKLTCFSTGLFACSAGARVTVYNNITAQSVVNTPSYFCNGPDFHVATCGVAPASNLLTYYGDGSSDSTHLSSYSADSSASADIYHNYGLPGAYTVKQVLRDGLSRQDSVTFSFNYNYCRTLPVFFYFDANSNCVYDYGDGSFYQPVSTEVDSNGIAIDTITAINGFYYAALGDSGTIYGFRVLSYDTGLHMACPSSGILYDTIGAFANTYTTRYFGFTCNTTTGFNLGLSTGLTCGRHVANGYIEVNNTYCNPVNPVVTMTFSPKYTFSSSWPAPFSVVGNTVTWHLPPLSVYNPYSFTWPYIWYELSVPGSFLVTGDTVNTSYKVTPYAGDVDTSNNYVTRVDTILSSYDPNRMSVSPRGLVIPCTPLIYTINFENTGNDTARNISVIDSLPDNTDPGSVKLVAASGAVNMAVMAYGAHTLVKFDFPHINLPDSSHHNKCSGVVVFSVRARQGLADGAAIFNHAGIYFDDNRPVLTDTVGNAIGISPITGPPSVCNTAHVQLNDGSQGGAWSSANSNASVTAGLVTGMAAGTDTIRYSLTSSCATKTATKAITINPVLVPAVSISSSSAAGDTVCAGVTPVFSATPVNGGTAPGYLWQVNGVGADTGSTFSYIPLDSDMLSVTLTSNALCAIPDTATTTLMLTVVTPYAPPITMDAFPGLYISPGMADTFTASVPPGGPDVSYQWLLNGAPVPGATSDTFISTTLANNDSITCVVSGNDLCHLSNFNSFVITVGNVGVKNIGTKGEIALFPNPNKGTFTIRGKTENVTGGNLGLEISNMLGETLYRTQVTQHDGLIDQQVVPGNALPKGLYLLTLHSGADNIMFRFVVE